MHRFLMRLTKHRPCKTIMVNDQPYLERYYMGGLFGYQCWLHRFLRPDSERHLHNHPWTAISVVLRGYYWEELPDGTGNYRAVGTVARIRHDHVHRVFYAKPDTWTLMLVGRKRHWMWHFIDDAGKTTHRRTSPRDWYRAYTPRGTYE